jgi:glycosyltransferase involved in cell wall biosynthesis
MNAQPAAMRYTALIRTRDSGPLVFETVRALRAQSLPPAKILAVDSGSSPQQLRELRAVVDEVLDISQQPFNYSRALNAGIAHCEGERVLVISSHVVLGDAGVVAALSHQIDAAGAAGGFAISTPGVAWASRRVDRNSFDGTNGLTNSCALVALEVLRALPFREEVFSAEDQEWTRRFLHGHRDGALVGVHTERVAYRNPHYSLKKKYNEEMALAIYVDRSRMALPVILRWVLRSLWAAAKGDLQRATHRLRVATGLLAARFRVPHIDSRYY